MVSVLAKPPSRIEPAVLELPWSSRASRFTLLRELKLAQECKGCVETLCKGCHGTEHPLLDANLGLRSDGISRSAVTAQCREVGLAGGPPYLLALLLRVAPPADLFDFAKGGDPRGE